MNDSTAIKPLGRCFWNGNEIVCESHPELGGIAGIGANVPEKWAHIFAAAPELLEALEHLLLASENADETGYVDGEGWLPLEEIQQKAHAAIAKAKGEAP